MGEVDRFHIGLVERVSRWGAGVLLASTAGLLLLDARAAAGLAMGGALSLGILVFHRGLADRCARHARRRAARVAFWAIWLVKWPVVLGPLYLILAREWVSAGWLCVGVGLVPAMVTGLALRAVVADGWRRMHAAGVKS